MRSRRVNAQRLQRVGDPVGQDVEFGETGLAAFEFIHNRIAAGSAPARAPYRQGLPVLEGRTCRSRKLVFGCGNTGVVLRGKDNTGVAKCGFIRRRPGERGETHAPRHRVMAGRLTTFPHNMGRWLWVLRSQGRRIMCSALARDELLQISIFKQRRHSFAISPHRFARVLPLSSRPLQTEGAGNAGRPMRPIAACAMVVVERTRVSQVTPESPGIPRAMVLTASFALSPVTGLSCHRHQRKLLLANLTPASGRQDHTTSPSASGALVFSAIRVHRIPPRVRDDRATPLCGTGRRGYRADLGLRKNRIFLQRGLDTPQSESDLICPSGKSNSLSGNVSRDGLIASLSARCRPDIRSWHRTDMPTVSRDVRSRGQSRKHLLTLSFSGFDPTRKSALLLFRAP